jgi:hypothetical protein
MDKELNFKLKFHKFQYLNHFLMQNSIKIQLYDFEVKKCKYNSIL